MNKWLKKLYKMKIIMQELLKYQMRYLKAKIVKGI